jgi:hypothetical protein
MMYPGLAIGNLAPAAVQIGLGATDVYWLTVHAWLQQRGRPVTSACAIRRRRARSATPACAA